MSRRETGIALWGGIECTLNRVGDRWFDQTERSGHARRIDDLDRFAQLGITALRYPVLWERIAPHSLNECDWRWTDERLQRLRDLHVRPIAGLLHHGSGPAYTSLVDPQFPRRFATFAGRVAERYPWLSDYTPINEPLTTARFSALYGLWYPHLRDDRSFVRALLNQAIATVLAMQAIRQINPDARLIQTEDCGACFGTPETARQVAFENHRRWLTFDLLAGRVTARHPLRSFLLRHGASAAELAFLEEHPTPAGVIGLNYYLTSDRYLDHRLSRYPPSMHGGNGRIRYADVDAVRARSEGIAGHEAHLLDAWQRYHVPVAITEVHLGCTREEQVRWLMEAWQGAQSARARGAQVEAITPWALLGSYDWDSLVTEQRNHYEPGAFDARSDPPRETRAARVIRELAAGTAPSHATIDAHGWWRRGTRFLYTRPLSRQMPESARLPHAPLLVIGSTGTLGRAFRRLAETRGLHVCPAGRADVDIARPESMAALLQRVRPWAVINATGYVRVDEAERDSDACFGVNTTGAVNIAAACRQHDVPMVTFSSDLVFDGSALRPYTEADEPRPLNVYGASKAEAERRVREINPQALIIRTSAFFGPWDEANFVVQMLRAIRQGRRCVALDDVVVSPTYVPDLVNATLDLLIDGETGIWHLANTGESTTWFDFAREAADACGESPHLIEPISAARAGWQAARPAFSALASVRGTVMRGRAEALAAFAEQHEERDFHTATA